VSTNKTKAEDHKLLDSLELENINAMLTHFSKDKLSTHTFNTAGLSDKKICDQIPVLEQKVR